MTLPDPRSVVTVPDEPALVEQWLNAHPDFVQDYVTRCPTPAVLDYLLRTRGMPTAIANDVSGSCSSRASSGANTPARKVSGQQFEKRGQTLGRMVTTVHGVPSFLVAGGGGTTDGSASGRRTSWARRGELKSMDSCELMNELILDICNDLDVTSLSHKILQNVCLLLDADRCSLFHVEQRRGWTPSDGGDERCLASKLFNVSAHSTVGECNAEEIRVPWGSGIIGHVAMTGDAINIPDAYDVCSTASAHSYPAD